MHRALMYCVIIAITIGASSSDVNAKHKHRRTGSWTGGWSEGWANGNQEEGSGTLTTKSLDLPAFTRIRSVGSYDINVTIGVKQSITVSADDNLHDNLSIKVKGKTLVLDVEESYSTRNRIEIEIVVEKLDFVSCDGSGDISVSNLVADEFAYKLGGSADFKASGTVGRLDLELLGSGEIDTRELVANDVYVEIAGSGHADVFAKESLEAVVSGSGDIRYYGDPAHKSTSVTGSGTCRRGR